MADLNDTDDLLEPEPVWPHPTYTTRYEFVQAHARWVQKRDAFQARQKARAEANTRHGLPRNRNQHRCPDCRASTMRHCDAAGHPSRGCDKRTCVSCGWEGSGL